MFIVVYNFKGGEGKSKIAMNLALTMGYAIVTNDIYSTVDNAFSDDKILKLYPNEPMPEFDSNDKIVFDFGGYPDARVKSILQKAKHIIVPITNEEDNIQVGINTIDEIQQHNQNVIIVANKTESGDLEAITKDLSELYQYPIFEIKKSRVVRRLSQTGKSIKELASEWSLSQRHFTKIANQFDELINFILSN